MPPARSPNTARARRGDIVAPAEAAAEIARLAAAVEAQADVIAAQARALAHGRKIFERASRAARIGVWECSLPDETLTWTDQVYDIFDIPVGTPLDRDRTLLFYRPASLAAMQALRSNAIAERSGFALDVEIITAKGRQRWIRVTATVECEGGVPLRIFGMKQDITDEKLLSDRTRYLATFDVLTGLANRASFQARLTDTSATESPPFGALLLVDLDDFKRINDSYGHAVGDDCLRIAAARLKQACPATALVARIGGDEFAVLLEAGMAWGEGERVAQAIVAALARPMAACDTAFRVGASVGIARATSERAADLYAQADAALYAAKAAGRNTFRTFDPDAMHAHRAGAPLTLRLS